MNEVEFLPERIRAQRARSRRLTRQGYLLACVVAGMCVLSVARQGRLAEAKAELATLESSQSNMDRQVAMIAPLERQMADLLIKKRIDDELGSRTDCTAVLAELAKLMPVNMTLTAFDLRTVEIAADKIKAGSGLARSAGSAETGANGETVVRRSRLVITGVAATDVDVANFIGQLSASPLFEDVNMGYAKTVNINGRQGREFQASCYLVR